MTAARALETRPVTLEEWDDLEALFGEKGACGGCWCMWWRLKRSEWEKGKGEGNRMALRSIVESGEVPGLLAYIGDEPVAWCSVGPRDAFPVLERSRVLARVDDEPVWSVVCFFVAKDHRRKGITAHLLEAVKEYARAKGATIVEGYPFEPEKDQPPAFVWTGLASAFRKAGFVEVMRRSRTRPIMRFRLL